MSPAAVGDTPLSTEERRPLRATQLVSYWWISPLLRFERLLIGCCRTVGTEASAARAVPAVLEHSASAGQRREAPAEEDLGIWKKKG